MTSPQTNPKDNVSKDLNDILLGMMMLNSGSIERMNPESKKAIKNQLDYTKQSIINLFLDIVGPDLKHTELCEDIDHCVHDCYNRVNKNLRAKIEALGETNE